MFRNLLAFITILILVSACAPTTQTIPVINNATSTSSPLPTADTTRTALPSETPTTSITPLPTISTFTPTFDVSTIVTVTPAPKAECPKENPNLAPTFYVPKFPGCFDTDHCVFSGAEEEILNYLNKGGSIQSAVSRLRTAIYGNYKDYASQDLTGDNIPDLMFIDFSEQHRMHILYCSNGHYEVFTSEKDPYGSDQMVWQPIIQDLNHDNLPEILFSQELGVFCCKLFTLEWNGTIFQNLSPNSFTQVQPTIKDIDKNGTLEIIGGANTEVYTVGLNRFGTLVFSWNGNTFELVKESFPSPTFRIQAVYDGDRETLNKDFKKALSSYQLVIDDLTLESWSEARSLYEQRNGESMGASILTDPTPLPNLTEYPRLASYAYYRIMLLHLAQGQISDATTVYNTLQEKFSNDQYGHPYVEMASAFWNAYQSAHMMYDGCAAAIEYTAEHPEILTPLGSDYHGAQSHTYMPADVCPFR